MRVLIVGGRSTLGCALRAGFADHAEIVAGGRAGCDVSIDLEGSLDNLVLPAGIDVVINTAAYFGSKTSDDLASAVRVNVAGPLNLYRACKRSGVRHFISVSSIFATLDQGSTFFSAYALSKRHSDEWLQMAASIGGPILSIVRPSQFYGIGSENRRHQPFLSTIIERASNNEDIVIYGKNDALRNFIHVRDVAAAIVRMTLREVAGVYACAYPENVRYSEIASAAIEAFESKSTVTFLSEKPDIPDNAFPFDDTLFRALDWYPEISISEGMRMEAAHAKGMQ